MSKAFRTGNKFSFPGENKTFTFVAYYFYMGYPTVLYEDEYGMRYQRMNIFLSELIHSQ